MNNKFQAGGPLAEQYGSPDGGDQAFSKEGNRQVEQRVSAPDDPQTADLSHRVRIATSLVHDPAAAAGLDRHLRWTFDKLIDELTRDDLNTAEVIAMNVILAGAHDRKLAASCEPGRVLRLIMRSESGADSGCISGGAVVGS